MAFVKPPTDLTTIVFRPYASGGGACYHAEEHFMRCVSWMTGTRIPLSQALEKKLRPCKRCFANQRSVRGKAMAERIGDKADYVRSQAQTRDHRCHWPGCTKQVPPAMWGCREHWCKLPLRIRNKIWQAYRIGQEVTMTPSREYVAAAREAQDWIKAQEPPQSGEGE